MFKNAINLFELFGFKIKIDPSWFLILVLIVWSLSTAYFPTVLSGYSKMGYVMLSILAAFGLFGSLILHELAHSLVARRFGVKINGITLFIFGGVAELEQEPPNAKSEFWIAIAGPIMSLCLGALALAIAGLLTGAGAVLFSYLGLINLVLALFNLVPAFPLDGGRVLRAALWAYKDNLIWATKIASAAGVGFAYLLIFGGVWSLFTGQTIGGLWQVLIGVFVLSASKSTYQRLLTKQALADQTVRALMSQQPRVAAPNDRLDRVVHDIMLGHNVSFVPVLKGDLLLGYVDTALAHKTPRTDWSETRIGDVYIAADETNSIHPDTLAQSLMDQIDKTGQRKYLVCQNSKLLGIITLADLLSFLAIRQQLAPPQ